MTHRNFIYIFEYRLLVHIIHSYVPKYMNTFHKNINIMFREMLTKQYIIRLSLL